MVDRVDYFYRRPAEFNRFFFNFCNNANNHKKLNIFFEIEQIKKLGYAVTRRALKTFFESSNLTGVGGTQNHNLLLKGILHLKQD